MDEAIGRGTMLTVDIVLPVHNEEEGLPVFHEELSAILGGLADRYLFHTIYVNDGSSDDSFAVLKRLAEHDDRVTVIHLSRRFGKELAVVAGIDHSHGDALIFLDSDLQHPPALIPEMLNKFEQGYDVVQAVRTYDPRISVSKRRFSQLFYAIQNALSPVQIPDGAADFCLVSPKVRAVFQGSIREQNQFLRGLFQWVGFRRTNVEFISPPRRTGSTKFNLLQLLNLSITGITSFSKVPLRTAAILGCVISGLSLLYGIFSIVVYLVVKHVPAGYTTLIVAVCFMGGLQLMVLGILGEYLGAVFDETKHRPLYIVDQVFGRDERRHPAYLAPATTTQSGTENGVRERCLNADTAIRGETYRPRG